ncbi:G surface protein, allelic form 156-like [Mya arenaria]|uniref:G surface protein, allelic form 156-like n=1 Tax=Mya arenaria TaxID=6604 RepID=UPI0022DEF38B|nr:G surface protein, allelic form 156-like [Mya arenaria]
MRMPPNRICVAVWAAVTTLLLFTGLLSCSRPCPASSSGEGYLFIAFVACLDMRRCVSLDWKYGYNVAPAIRWSSLVFGCVLVFRHGAEAAVAGTTCSANGNECAAIANSFCDVTNTVCKCVDIATEDAATSTCPLTACPNGDSDCSDANSECSTTSSTCTCTSAYYLDGADDANLCVGKPVGETCTASGSECTTITNGFCDTSGAASVCACGTVYSLANCIGADCSTNGDSDCTGVDPNSVCVGSAACGCKATYGIHAAGTSGLCQPGVGATCTASGSECQYLTGGYCDTTATPVCACADIMMVQNTIFCEAKSCAADSTCTTADANSECVKGLCACKSTYELDGTSKSCVATGGSNAITASIAVMLMSLLVSVLQH